MEEAPGVRLLQLGGHRGQPPRAWALVDEADFEFLNQWNWSYLRGYASALVDSALRRPTLLHRLLLDLPAGDPRQGDHINRNRLDNRRANLRIVTGPENWQNVPARTGSTSPYRGVSWCASRRKWLAQAQHQGRTYNLGRYALEQSAAEAARAFRAAHMPFASEKDHLALA